MPRRSILLALALFFSSGMVLAGPLRVESLRYDFSGGALSGWSAPGGVLDSTGGAASLRVRDALSAFLSPGGLRIDAACMNRIEIDIRFDPPGTGGALYWTDDAEGGFVPEWRVQVQDGRNVLDLSDRPEWSGAIDRILIAPGRGARSARLLLFEVRGPRGLAERGKDAWRRFFRTELRSDYSVNGILGASVGPAPFALVLGVLFVIVPLLVTLRRPRAFPERARRLLPRWLLVGTLLFLARSACDEVRIGQADLSVLGGKSLDEKIAAVNPPGFYGLLVEAKRIIPPAAPVELRAAKPYPWERGGYYLYPNRVALGAEYVISYRMPAPNDSASCRLLFRREGVGSVYGRGSP